jgi:hypothetical protein
MIRSGSSWMAITPESSDPTGRRRIGDKVYSLVFWRPETRPVRSDPPRIRRLLVALVEPCHDGSAIQRLRASWIPS